MNKLNKRIATKSTLNWNCAQISLELRSDIKTMCAKTSIIHKTVLSFQPQLSKRFRCRYGELVATYGVPTQLAEVDLSPQTSVEVLLRFGEKSLLQKVDVRWTLQQLKKELVEFVGEPAKNFRVFLNDPEAWYVFDEMRLPSKKIFSYGVKDGVEILIELKPSIESSKKKDAASQGITP